MQLHENSLTKSGLLTNGMRKDAQPMGTIRGQTGAAGALQGTMGDRGESTFGSDFDANNRTMSQASSHNQTLKATIDKNMEQKMITEYDKKWVNDSAKKEYLQDTKNITIDFGA